MFKNNFSRQQVRAFHRKQEQNKKISRRKPSKNAEYHHQSFACSYITEIINQKKDIKTVNLWQLLRIKRVSIRSFSSPHFSIFVLNAVIYGIDLKFTYSVQTQENTRQKTSKSRHFSRSECNSTLSEKIICCTFAVSYHQRSLGLKDRERHIVCNLHKLTNSCSENLQAQGYSSKLSFSLL